jgi:hypothetical protein
MHLSRRAKVLALIAGGLAIVLASGLYGSGDAPVSTPSPGQQAAAVAPTAEPTQAPEVVPPPSLPSSGQAGQASPPPTVAARVPATPTPAPIIVRPIAITSFTIDNTLGRGMPLRAAPRSRVTGKPWPDGTRVEGLGAEQDVNGWTWSRVRDPEGNVGWVPTNYLVPEEGGDQPGNLAPGVSPPSAPPTQIIVPTLPVPPPTAEPTPVPEPAAPVQPTPERPAPSAPSRSATGASRPASPAPAGGVRLN